MLLNFYLFQNNIYSEAIFFEIIYSTIVKTTYSFIIKSVIYISTLGALNN